MAARISAYLSENGCPKTRFGHFSSFLGAILGKNEIMKIFKKFQLPDRFEVFSKALRVFAVFSDLEINCT